MFIIAQNADAKTHAVVKGRATVLPKGDLCIEPCDEALAYMKNPTISVIS